MPRARKTATGAKAQPPTPVAGQTYGMGVEQQRLAEAMPSPLASGVAPPPAQAPNAASVPLAPADPFAAAQAMAGRAGVLRPPTQRPNEPLTAGMTRGPGPGPSALPMPSSSPLGDTMRRLAQISGDPYLAELAAKARL